MKYKYFSVPEFKRWLIEEGLLNYPINELDEAFYQETGKPPSGKYAKMLARATPLVDSIWKHCIEFKTTFHDIDFLLKFPITERVVYCYIENCVIIDLKLQLVKKAITKSKQEKDIQEYYNQFSLLNDLNMFDLTFKDVQKIIDKQGYHLDIDQLKQYYSEYSKKMKKEVK